MRGKRLFSAILGPLILATDLILLLGSEVICDIESLSNLLRRLPLDHICNGFASNVEEWLDIEIVRRLDIKLD